MLIQIFLLFINFYFVYKKGRKNCINTKKFPFFRNNNFFSEINFYSVAHPFCLDEFRLVKKGLDQVSPHLGFPASGIPFIPVYRYERYTAKYFARFPG